MKQNIKSVLVLTCICLAVSVMLAVTNHFTKDRIAANNNKAAFEACFVVMPDAKDFEEVNLSEYTGLPASLTNAYKEKTGLGYAYKVVVTGKAPNLTIMVGIDNTGKITNSTVVSSGETPSYFGGAIEANYSSQFSGKDSTLAGITTISGATISTKAYMGGVMDAFSANAIIAGMEVTKSKEMLIAEILTNTMAVEEVTTTVELGANVTAVYNSKQYDGLAVEVTINEINYYICLGYDGKVLGYSASSKDEISAEFTLESTATNAVETELLAVASAVKENASTLVTAAIGTKLQEVLEQKDSVISVYNATFTLPSINKDLEYIPDHEEDYVTKKLSAKVTAIFETEEAYIYFVKAQGHNGEIVLLVSTTKAGAIIDTHALAQVETEDYASDVWTDSYDNQFNGITTLPEDIICGGATVTSTAYSTAVKCALEAYKLIAGGQE